MMDIQSLEIPESIQSISENRYHTVHEVAQLCGVSASQARYWEERFSNLRPRKGKGNRRFYLKKHMLIILMIKHLLKREHLTIDQAIEYFTGKPVKKKIKRPTLVPLDLDYSQVFRITPKFIMGVCDVTINAARRYISSRKAPSMAVKLIYLYANGRVLPDSWNHCFINALGKLEFHGVGEMSESEIVSMEWSRKLYYDQVKSLEHRLEKANQRIKQLEHCLDEANAQMGKVPAAND